jgi:dihydropteroate synthase
MEYREAAAALASRQRHRPKLGVDTTQRLLAALGDPQDGIDVVQVAGSNGKGSTARMLESVLAAADLEVGLFTSPALDGFRDQIRVDGRRIPREAVTTVVAELQPCLKRLAAEDDAPTHFEVLTALAVAHFGRRDVDVAVLEVGIGGRYDATSAVDPLASAVTSVSLEHTDLLGDTVPEIARDKAQVAPADPPLVTAATGSALDAIREVTPVVTVGAEDADVLAVETTVRPPAESRVSLAGADWSVETELPLVGQHQARNAGVAAALARQVAGVDPDTIAAGLRSVTWPGRFEVVDRDPTVVLDGAHNPGAVRALTAVLDDLTYRNLHLVFGAMTDKDHAAMAAALPAVETVTVTRPEKDRAASTAALAGAFEGQARRIDRVESVASATDRAVDLGDRSDLILVTGSLFAVAEAREGLVHSSGFDGGAAAGIEPGAVNATAEPTDLRTDPG